MSGDCLGNIPFASLISFIFVFVGGGIMAGTLFEAIRLTDKYFRDNFYPVEELKIIQIAGVVAASVVVALAIILLIFGILATGATRSKIYKGDKCILGGRFSAGLFICLAFIMKLFWICVACFLMIPLVGYMMMERVCYEEWTYWKNIDGDKTGAKFFTNFKFNLTHYGIYKKLYTFQENYNETITTSTNFEVMCNQVRITGPLYLISWAGSLFIVFGLACYVSSLSANFTRLKYTKELTDYRAAIDDNTELDYMTNTVHSMHRPIM